MTGKGAWIIGGGSGIGAAVAQLLSQRGWSVVISGRDRARLDAVASSRPAIYPLVLDVRNAAACEAAAVAAVAKLGRIDLFLFGAVQPVAMPVGDYRIDSFTAAVDTNLLGLVRLANPVIQQMERQGGGDFAAISSLLGYLGLPGTGAYSATKAALASLCESMRTELAPKGIRVRLIAPGFIETPLTAHNKGPMPLVMGAAEAAARIVDALEYSSRFEIAFPRRMAWLTKVATLLPYPLYFRLASRLLRISG